MSAASDGGGAATMEQVRMADAAVGSRPGTRSPVLLDAHGHFYSCFDAARFLDHTAKNFAAVAATVGVGDTPPGHLVIAATARGDGLADLRERCDAGRAGAWRIVPTAERESVRAIARSGAEVVLLAGRQVVTAEGVEVLTMLRDVAVPDGAALGETIAAARAAGATVVLPWGLGKWWFGRGRLVRQAATAHTRQGVFLGDSANRARGLREPAAMRLGRGRGVRVLSGTDPLPLTGAESVAGRYGSVVEATFDPARPAAALRGALEDGAVPRAFGERRSAAGCLVSQVRLRVAAGGRGGSHG
jgi:hypothetical protein